MCDLYTPAYNGVTITVPVVGQHYAEHRYRRYVHGYEAAEIRTQKAHLNTNLPTFPQHHARSQQIGS